MTTMAPYHVRRAPGATKYHVDKEDRLQAKLDFSSCEERILLHASGFVDTVCDQGHFPPAFRTYNRAILLRSELCSLAIDQQIGALRYWNVMFDSENRIDSNTTEKFS